MDDILAVLKQVEEEKILECSTTEEFYDRLLNIGCRSRAADHPYFHGMRDGTLPNVLLALCDYALQKSALHNHFKEARGCADEEYAATQPLRAIRMETPKAAPILINLEQRSISVVDAKYEDLFGRLLKALEREAGSEGLAMLPQVNVGRYFGEEFGRLVESENFLFLLGVLSIRTFPVVHTVYRYILEAFKKYTRLSPREYFFYQLGSELETPLYGYLKEKICTVCKTREDRWEVSKGFAHAAACQSRYWDRLYRRALGYPRNRWKDTDRLEIPISPVSRFNQLKSRLLQHKFDHSDLEVLPEESQEHSSISSNTYSLGKPSV
ncbi:uncharacterized protein Gasu_15400 [Galdieria sulphuraria]|uniref:Uncharacterized protein n=1 Tax=Galdieria sulphuraria TaxID=130081 RepID=M2X4E9_GALSU|nr:uncharacterized protein Gasu_15400 [Galdieria sulphuraria]EME31305.1 hypothetical protein Gasu_15400 [Galdieria sulphuraria]|eukprot:XP_005707825.1 hypothetical protein Gasu_15400 [Galdieria sulphuraria]